MKTNTPKNYFLYLLLTLFIFSGVALAQPNNNGTIDNIGELYTKKTIMLPMPDSVRLATDVYLPILQDDYNYTINVGFANGTIKILKKGTQYLIYPNQTDPKQLSAIMIRTPYNKNNDNTGSLMAILGYMGVVQDMRGRFSSEGVYIPMHPDGWKKTPYYNWATPLDVSSNQAANEQEDGVNSINSVANMLRWSQDTLSLQSGSLLSNGSIGMLGTSALGNAQYSAAAARKIDGSSPLRCLMPIVGSGEFYNSAGFNNGVFRELLIKGWLGDVLNDLTNQPDNSRTNTIHTPFDYNLTTIEEVKEKSFDAWTTWQRASYPNSKARYALDISRATVNSSGNGDTNSNISRYTNMNVPAYHLTGWWDIFIDGQIKTFQQTRKYLNGTAKQQQKLVIGPWTHQTIGGREVGDMRGINSYESNVEDILKININQVTNGNAVNNLFQSELLQWFRYHLGEPQAIIPEGEWQNLSIGQVKVPAQDYIFSYENFIKFLNGTVSLSNVPVAYRFTPTANPTLQNITIPATGNSVFGSNITFVNMPEFNESANNGIPAVRFYVTGPINDGVAGNEQVGNYWLAADTFPLPQTTYQSFYFSNNGIQTQPITSTVTQSYLHNPDNPVGTVGGANMILVRAGRASQGQMNLADSTWANLTMNRPDVIQFSTPVLTDTLRIIGFPKMKLFAKSVPVGANAGEPTDTDFMVRLLDVYPDGREMFITEGTVNARARLYARSVAEGNENDNAPFSNIQVDSVYEYDFELLPLAYTLGKNHQLKVLISSSNYPRYQANPNLPINDNDFFRRSPNDGKTYTFNGTVMQPRPALQTIFMGGNTPTQLYLPTVGNITSIASNLVQKKWQVSWFPNPSSGHFALTLAQPIAEKTQLTVLDIAGKVVMKQNITAQTTWINLTHLPKGVYVAITHNSQAKHTQKLVIW